MMTFLTGVKKTKADGTVEMFYRILTAKPDTATGALEELECSAAHLHIVAGGNLRQKLDEAIWDRFDHYRIKFTKALVVQIARGMCAENGIAAGTLPETWADIADESRAAAVSGSISYPMGMRVLENAIKSSDSAGEAMLKAATRLDDKVANWDADLGESTNEADKLVGGWCNALKKAAADKANDAPDAAAPADDDDADADAGNE
jgi:hypothetical protein